jgi:ubiquinone/menaquinone biosynthesis C-methylase UbiE
MTTLLPRPPHTPTTPTTQTGATDPKAQPTSEAQPRADWRGQVALPVDGTRRVVPLHNTFGCVLPPEAALLRELLDVRTGDEVLDLTALHARGVDLTALPYGDRRFAVAICRGVLDEVDDPAAVCRELQRVARRGVIELTHRHAALTLGCAPTVQWLATNVDGALVLQRRPFVRHPLGQPRWSPLAQSADGQLLQQWQLRNVAHLTFAWEDGFDCEVHDDGGYQARDDEQLGLAWLDVAECGLRWQAGDIVHLLTAAETAVRLLPNSARAQYVRGQWLWLAGRSRDAQIAFLQASALAPDDARILAAATRPLRSLPPTLPPAAPHEVDQCFWNVHAHDAGLDLATLLAPPRRRQPASHRDDPTVSRFVREGDRRLDHFVFPMPPTWWSRGHEYAWAEQFAGPEHVVLDAACGIGHPLKLVLAQRCRATFACDLDPRIDDPEQIVADIQPDFGAEAAQAFARASLQRLERTRCSITATPYGDAAFDRVFCISVLEHLPADDRKATLREFARIVRPNGLVLLTMDHPLVDLDEFVQAVAAAGLRFVGDVRRHVPLDALWSGAHGLRCFRALLQRA